MSQAGFERMMRSSNETVLVKIGSENELKDTKLLISTSNCYNSEFVHILLYNQFIHVSR